jgi:hypothetical protein
VFLSYASQDAEAAKKICDALREAGIEVWFDKSELGEAMSGTARFASRYLARRHQSRLRSDPLQR